MRLPLVTFLFLRLAVTAAVFAGDLDKKTIAPSLEDSWAFKLSVPGWLAGIEGDVGIGGAISHIDVDPGNLIRHIDMATMLRGEASNGRFGVTGDFIYLSLSDGIGTNTVIKKLDFQVDEIIGDLGLRWRLIEGKRGYLDVIGGVRYVNLYQKLALQPSAERINDTSTRLVDAVSDRLGSSLTGRLSGGALQQLVAAELSDRLAALEPGRPSTLPIGPLGGHFSDQIRARIASIIESRKDELAAALQAAAQATEAAARERAQARVEHIKQQVSDRIARSLTTKLDTTVSRTDDWLDPYLGLRGRYNFTDRVYLTAKGDVGGFGIGSDFTWQAEAALGWQLTHNIFAEAGYRALGIDYEDNGLTYDTITHGAQVMVGINF